MSLLLAATAGSANYTITAQAGSYAVTGQAATLSKGRLIVSSPGAYSATGQSVTLLRTKLVSAQAGSYGVAGQGATVLRSKQVVSLPGAYSITGFAADATVSSGARSLVALPGAYVVSGRNAIIGYEPASHRITGGGYYHVALPANPRRKPPISFEQDQPKKRIPKKVRRVISRAASEFVAGSISQEPDDRHLIAAIEAQNYDYRQAYYELYKWYVEQYVMRQLKQHAALLLQNLERDDEEALLLLLAA